MPNKLEEIFGTAAALAKGMGVTLKEMVSPDITENYPDEPPTLEERYRGTHVLQRDENGLEKCVACFLCAAACPAQCIYIEAAENTGPCADQRRRAICEGVYDRLQPLYFLRVLRGSVSDGCDYTRAWLRISELQHLPRWFTAKKICWHRCPPVQSRWW